MKAKEVTGKVIVAMKSRRVKLAGGEIIVAPAWLLLHDGTKLFTVAYQTKYADEPAGSLNLHAAEFHKGELPKKVPDFAETLQHLKTIRDMARDVLNVDASAADRPHMDDALRELRFAVEEAERKIPGLLVK